MPRSTRALNKSSVNFDYRTVTVFGLTSHSCSSVNKIYHSFGIRQNTPLRPQHPVNNDCRLFRLQGLGSSDFARRYFRNHFYFLLVLLLRCFSSQAVPHITIDSLYDSRALPREGSPIRIPTDQGLLTTPRGFSQSRTSFFGLRCQGIRH